MTVNRILLDEKLHAEFLAQGRKDPYTKEPLLAGMEIVICANCKRAFDAATWSGECPGDHGTRTLREIPTEEFPSHFDRNARPQPSNSNLAGIIIGGIVLVVVISLLIISGNQSSTSNPIAAPRPTITMPPTLQTVTLSQPMSHTPMVALTSSVVESSTSIAGLPPVSGYIATIRSQVSVLKFFGFKNALPPKAQWQYQVTFQSSEVQHVYWELDLSYPTPGAWKIFTIEYHYVNPDSGTEYCSGNYDVQVQPKWNWSWIESGCGFVSQGKYQVDLYVSGIRIVSGVFSVY